jgi:predicted GNAT family N-acyltransferase
MIEIKQIKAVDTYGIRLEILRNNIQLPYKFNGDFDEDTFHLGAFKNKKLIAVSSFMKTSNNSFKRKQYQLRGMATLNEYQGEGAGKLMLQHAFSILKGMKINVLWCNARVKAVNFYENLGLKTIGEKFVIERVGDHFVMYIEFLKK